MNNLFAFSQAEDMPAYTMPSGRYDAEQQLWIADEVSYATERMPIEGGTSVVTDTVTMSGNAVDFGRDYTIDW